jgi:hypothetical protein
MTEPATAANRPDLEAFSAFISRETFRSLTETAAELGCPHEVAAMIAGNMEGLARYLMAIQTTDTTPGDIGDMFAEQFTRFLTQHAMTAQGEA